MIASDPSTAIAARLRELWHTSRPVILERLAVLRASHSALAANLHDAEARSLARETAHKLSGVLGVFGLPHGSEIAQRLEDCLQSPHPLTPDDLSWLAAQTDDLDALIAAKP
jgi:HPt (histidine-containing phosphotransfer) domain-containing protein